SRAAAGVRRSRAGCGARVYVSPYPGMRKDATGRLRRFAPAVRWGQEVRDGRNRQMRPPRLHLHGRQRRPSWEILQRALQGERTEHRTAVRMHAPRLSLIMDVPERYEQLIAYLDSQLPQPVDRQTVANGALQFTGGDPAQVVVLLTDTSVVVSEFAGVWETPF